jgi:hypothetical protein
MIFTPTLPPQPIMEIASKELVQSRENFYSSNLSAQLKGKVLSKITLQDGKTHIGELSIPKEKTDFVNLKVQENGKLTTIKIPKNQIRDMENYTPSPKTEEKSGNIGTITTRNGKQIKGTIYSDENDVEFIKIDTMENGEMKTYRFHKTEIRMSFE